MAGIQEIGQYIGRLVRLDAIGGNTRGQIQAQGFRHLGSAEDTAALGKIKAGERNNMAREGILSSVAAIYISSEDQHSASAPAPVNRAVPGTPRVAG
ncbi:MAG: hypothetical protein AAB599_02455 [Patescibacteria group bacterium]